MARDDNDRSYDDGQGRPGNPDLTGDVLSPRWSTDDTDEQPAIQVAGNETYILPPAPGEAGDPYQSQGEPAYGDSLSGPYDAQAGAYGDDHREPAYPDAYAENAGGYADTYADTYAGDEPSDPRGAGEDRDEAGYLPL
ncbi:hypothetical protein OUY22_36570, partial [Nonomuraea sp. MCN248]